MSEPGQAQEPEGREGAAAAGQRSLVDHRTEAQILRSHRLESVGHLAGGVAHDFNNILGVILGYVELAKMNMHGAEPKVQRHLELALATLGRARTLADRLLEFTRQQVHVRDLSDLNEAVQEVRELLAETLDRRVKFEVNLGSDLPPSPLDVDAMRQVVTNLCLNAAEAMPEGGRIEVDTRRVEVRPGGVPELPPGVYCGLRVRDTGPGISAGDRARVFEPYYTTRPGTHSGLGLWVVRGLVERFDGRVEVSGDEDGAVFTLWLPARLHVWARARLLNGEPADSRTTDVLVVDDEPGVREVTRAFLEMEGYSVLEARTGDEALETLRARPGGVRIVFLDHLLPDAQGTELAWQIRAMEDPPCVVMMTGLPGAAEGRDLPAGTRVLAKPFLHDDVSRLLEDLSVVPSAASD
jgi:hypothetical protein